MRIGLWPVTMNGPDITMIVIRPIAFSLIYNIVSEKIHVDVYN
jgi:hypothetical protein